MKSSKDNIVLEKSKKFAIRVIKLYKQLCDEKKEYVLSKQLLRSGTSIGANIMESTNAQSTADFISKLSISQKEASETEYWLEIMYETDYLNKEQFESLNSDLIEIQKLLTSIIKTSKNNCQL